MSKLFKINATLTLPENEIANAKRMVEDYFSFVCNQATIEFKTIEEVIEETKSKYTVTFTKEETYEVEAASCEEAEDKALDMYNADEYAFDSDTPIADITIERVGV